MTSSSWTILRRIAGEVYPYWPQLLGIFVLSLLSTPLALLAPLPMKIVIDHVLGSQGLPWLLAATLPDGIAQSRSGLLAVAVVLVVTIAFLNQLRGFVTWVLQTWAGERMVHAFRTRLFSHAQRLSLAYHDAKGASDSAFRIQYDAPALQYVMVNGIIPLLSSVSQLVGMIWVTLLLDWKLALIALAVSPVLFILIQIFSARLRRGWEQVTALGSSANAIVHEVLSSLRVVKAFAREDYEHMRYRKHSYGLMKEQVQVSMTQGLFDLAIVVTVAGGTALTLYVGVLHIQAGLLTLGNLVLLLAYVAQLYDPLQVVSKKLTDIQASMVGARRAFQLLDQEPEVKERPDALLLKRATGHVQFENVFFSYGSGRQVLENVSLDAKPGMRVGIQGETGAGKSTLLSLLIRFYDVSDGRILLDGVDIKDYKLTDLRNQFSIVLQDSVLLSTSVAENISYGRDGATRAEVIEAATLANAHDFIMRLSDGYDTMVGERGMLLSGGERQRIALARAFLKDAPILILDEPTSSVDVKTEGAILEALHRLMQARTTFIIAHRLNTLDDCDLRFEISSNRLRALNPAAPDSVKLP